ncbi:MAG TPA: CBS domain-containing protein [Patescibacteria group bacterium]|nr:CBS domain-containing protein [Patescibacteria group bacterium]
MSYLSQIVNSPVRDAADRKIGKVKDLIVTTKPGQYAPVAYLLVKGKSKGRFFVSYDQVSVVGKKETVLKKVFEKNLTTTVVVGDEYVNLVRDILDQQIVDTEGARVVRVNDLRLGILNNQMVVVGIDVSFKGLLRRLGLAWLDVFDRLKVNLIDWRDTERLKGGLKLEALTQNLKKLHPADLADIIEDLSIKQGRDLVTSLESEEAAKVFEELDPHLQKVLVRYLGPKQATNIIEKMSVDEIVDFLQTLSKYDARQFLSRLQRATSTKVKKLLAHRDDTAGGLMTTDYITISPEATVADAIEEVKRVSHSMRSILYLYLIDHRDIFKGTVSLRRLLIAKSDQKLKDIVRRSKRIETLRTNDDVEEVMDTMTRYNLYSAAVLDEKHRLVGVITIDDVMRYMRPKA